MKADGKPRLPSVPDPSSRTMPVREGMKELPRLSGRDALDRILEAEHPVKVVQGMARVDFYWLVKKIGDDDALPLIELASPEQWAHLLDMEVWVRDRLDPHQASLWLERFQRASPGKLVTWLYGEGESICSHFLSRNIQVEVRRGEELLDLPQGFFTLDNLFYIKVLDKEQEEWITNLLRQMASGDYPRFQALLLSLAGVLPAELEEEMYRSRNVRLAEDGFLPFDEAVSLYAYLKAEAIRSAPSTLPVEDSSDAERTTLVPMIPFLHVEAQNLFVQAAGMQDLHTLDRLRLEFAGLCNQLISADLAPVSDLQVLLRACRKAAGYLNLGLERLSGDQPAAAGDLLRKHPLASIFRIGFGLTLELRWEAERGVRDSWFTRVGLSAGFWGEAWGGLLLGLLRKRPLYYAGYEGEEETRPFERLSEVEGCREALRRIFALDRFLGILTTGNPLGRRLAAEPLVTYHTLMLTFWARGRLGLAPGFEPLSLESVRRLFRDLRKGEAGPPFRMPGAEGDFLGDLMGSAGDLDQDAREILRKTLSDLWREFTDEYAWMEASDLDARFTRFLLIEASLRSGSPAP
ncbi:MAG: DUF6178 family protein [Thermodesulfobacteriota bacterium]